jgi:acyl-CoA reductase-like NAD-dependent aldehyde dehydrogenase
MFLLSGQGCICLKRLYIHEDIYPAVTDALVAVARSAKVGNGLDPGTALGPVQNHLQYQRLQSAWEEITNSGATILFRGDLPANEKGFFFPVTLLDNPPEDASYVAQKSLAPFVPSLSIRLWTKQLVVPTTLRMDLGPQSGGTIQMNFNA